jgi:hypothetical protein
MTSEQWMNPGARMQKDAEARLRALVPHAEAIVAVGTAEELRELRPDIGSGSGFTFLVVTSDRLVFAELSSDTHYEIRLNEIEGWAAGTQYNRLAIVLTHPPMSRRLRISAHKILWFRWGNAVADFTLTQTIFRFSRPETQAAIAIRSALTARGVPHRNLHFEEKSREERTRGSHARLYAKED